jgi:hypothetical protein
MKIKKQGQVVGRWINIDTKIIEYLQMSHRNGSQLDRLHLAKRIS